MVTSDITPIFLIKQLKIRFCVIGFMSIIISFFAKMDLWLICVFQVCIWVIVLASIGSLTTISQQINAKFPFKDRKELR